MSETITPTAATLPQGFCPSTEQDRLDQYAESLSITIGDYYGQFVISSTTPDPADQDKIWLKLDGSDNPIGFFKYVSGAWTQIDAPNVWVAVGGGSANAYTLTLSNYPSSTGPRTRDVFIFSVPAANTGASTLNLNSTGAKSIKSGGSDLWSGALGLNKWYLCVYDGTNYEVEAIKQLLASDVPAGADNDFFRTRNVSGTLTSQWESPFVGAETAIPGAGSPATFAHLLPVTPCMVDVRLRCKTSNLNWAVNDEVRLESLFYSVGDNEHPAFTVYANASQVGVVRNSAAAAIQLADKSSGSDAVAITEGSWKLVCYAIR